MKVSPFGDRALRFALPERGPRQRAALLAALRAEPGVLDVVLAEDVGLVRFAEERDATALAKAIGRVVAAPRGDEPEVPRATHRVPVVYDGADLDEVARLLGLTRSAVVDRHAGATYAVAMLGFLPGFAYLRPEGEGLVVPRLASPRPRVPPGSLAIAAEYTGIYPFASPGGWRLLGRVADAVPAFSTESGARFALGDRVELAPVDDVEAARAPVTPPLPAPEARLEVLRARGPAIVVDGGRHGRAHEGVPAGGALVPRAFTRANRAAGNRDGAAALEIYGSLDVRALAAVVVADGAGRTHALDAGETLSVGTGGAVRATYLAVRGGIDVPVVLGSRGTLLVAGFGGLEGRPLRRGDAVAVGDDLAERRDVEEGDDDAPLELLPGPDADDEALSALFSRSFRISAASDRTGTRLEGDPLPAPTTDARRRSVPMVLGAIERTPGGFILLGPDHPTTGGYPVVAVLRERAQSAFFAMPIGGEVRFTRAAR